MIATILLIVFAAMLVCLFFMRFMFRSAQTLNRSNQYEEYVRDRRETRRRARSRRREEERLKNEENTEG
jgi:predicted Holliday junction resolvase-like endonuclease